MKRVLYTIVSGIAKELQPRRDAWRPSFEKYPNLASWRGMIRILILVGGVLVLRFQYSWFGDSYIRVLDNYYRRSESGLPVLPLEVVDLLY